MKCQYTNQTRKSLLGDWQVSYSGLKHIIINNFKLTTQDFRQRRAPTLQNKTPKSYKTLLLSPTFSSFSKCSRRNFIGRSGLAMQRFTMHSLRICWMLCFCTKISQPFKLSSSSRVEEEVAILSFISVAVGENRVDHERRGRTGGKGGAKSSAYSMIRGK